jgi:hypothetical protein
MRKVVAGICSNRAGNSAIALMGGEIALFSARARSFRGVVVLEFARLVVIPAWPC